MTWNILLISQAMAKEKMRQNMVEMDDRRRKFHSNYETKEVTDVELEAYRRTRLHPDDPLAKFKDKLENDAWLFCVFQVGFRTRTACTYCE